VLNSTTKINGNIVTKELFLSIKASDNGASYKCTATNQATATPLEAVVRLIVYCKYWKHNFPPFHKFGVSR